MNPYQRILGNWRFPSTVVAETDEFIHIGADGRIVYFVHHDSSGTNFHAMKLWCEPLGEDRFRVRMAPQETGWTVGMIPTPSGMTIAYHESTVHLRRSTDEDLPEWFPIRLRQALARMATLEAEEGETTPRPRD